MKYYSIINLVFLLLVSIVLFNGCGTSISDSEYLVERQIPQLSSLDSCNKSFNDELTDSILEKVEEKSAELIFTDSNSNKSNDDAEVLLNPKWIQRLGDDATYFINYNEQLNKERVSLLSVKDSMAQNGVVMSACQMSDEAKLNISFAKQNNIQSNFPNLVESYNESVIKRNASYEEKLSNFQRDFQGTNFITRSKEFLDKKANSDYLKNLYQSRIKYLLIILRDLENEKRN